MRSLTILRNKILRKLFQAWGDVIFKIKAIKKARKQFQQKQWMFLTSYALSCLTVEKLKKQKKAKYENIAIGKLWSSLVMKTFRGWKAIRQTNASIKSIFIGLEKGYKGKMLRAGFSNV